VTEAINNVVNNMTLKELIDDYKEGRSWYILIMRQQLW
jgi:hypothetical protein